MDQRRPTQLSRLINTEPQKENINSQECNLFHDSDASYFSGIPLKTSSHPQRLEEILNGNNQNMYWINSMNLRRKEDKTKKEQSQVYTPTIGRISIRANSLSTNQHGNQEITPNCFNKPPEELILADLTFNLQKSEKNQSNDGEKQIENQYNNTLKKRPHRFTPSSLSQNTDDSKKDKRELMHTSPIQNRNRNQVDNHSSIAFSCDTNAGVHDAAVEIKNYSDALSKELIDRCQLNNKVRSSSGTPLSDKKKMWISKTRRPTREEFSAIDVSLPGSSLSNKSANNDKIRTKSGLTKNRDDSIVLEILHDSLEVHSVDDKPQELGQVKKPRTQNIAAIEQNNMTFYPRQQQKQQNCQQNLANEHIRRRIFDDEELEIHSNLFKKSNLGIQSNYKNGFVQIPNNNHQQQHTFVIQKNGYAVLQRNEASSTKQTKKIAEDKKDKLFSQIEDQLLIKPFSLRPKNAGKQTGKDKMQIQQNESQKKEINENVLAVEMQQSKNEKGDLSSEDIGISADVRKRSISEKRNESSRNCDSRKDSKKEQIQLGLVQLEDGDILEQTGRFGRQPEEDQLIQKQQETKLQERSEQTEHQRSFFCAIDSSLDKLINPTASPIQRNTPSNYEKQHQQFSQFKSQKQQPKQFNTSGDQSLVRFDDEDFSQPAIMHIPLITTKKQIRILNCATSTKNNGRHGTLLSNYDFPLAEIVTTPSQQQQQSHALAGWRKYDFYQEKNASNNNNNNSKFNSGFQFLGLENSQCQLFQQEQQSKQQQHRAKSSSNRFPREIFTPNVEKAKRLNSQCQPTRQPSLSPHSNF